MELELDRLFGLPAHPLLVHVPVVLIPTALVAAAIALWRPVRRPALGAAAAMAVVGAIGAVLAVGAGDKLQERVRETEQVEEHAEQGEQVELPAIAFGLLALGAALASEAAHRSPRSHDRSTDPATPHGNATARPAAVGAADGPGGAHPTAPGAVATDVRAAAPPVAADTPPTTPAAARWAAALLALSLVAGAAASYTVIRAGHSGAQATWHDTPDERQGSGGDVDAD